MEKKTKTDVKEERRKNSKKQERKTGKKLRNVQTVKQKLNRRGKNEQKDHNEDFKNGAKESSIIVSLTN